MSDPQDMKAANASYAGFIGILKWSVPAIALIALLVVVMISS